MISPQSLRFRLLASVVAIEVILATLLVWNNINIIQTTHNARLNATATSMIEQISLAAGKYMVEVDYATLKNDLLNAMKYEELSYLTVLDRDEQPVIRLGLTEGQNLPLPDASPAQVTDATYDISHDISVSGQYMGRVLMGFSLSLMEEAIVASRNRGISIAVAAIVLTVLVTILIGLGLTRRLKRLSEAALRVQEGDYDIKIPAGNSDEVGCVVEAFNRMVAEIARRSNQLEASETQTRLLLAENRRLIRASLEVQEAERKHLARELHDEMGQCITAIQADAALISDLSRDQDPRIATSSEAINKVSKWLYEVVHSMMQRLRPGILDDLGLVDALKDEIAAWKRHHEDIQCVFSATGDLVELGERTNIMLYRIVQEGLTNISKHAVAGSVAIDLAMKQGYLQLMLQDDGVGMDLDVQTRGLGLIGMRERVEALNGTLEIVSAPQQGLVITIKVPEKSLGDAE